LVISRIQDTGQGKSCLAYYRLLSSVGQSAVRQAEYYHSIKTFGTVSPTSIKYFSEAVIPNDVNLMQWLLYGNALAAKINDFDIN